MPEEKATINEGSADLSGPDKATKDKISESILARARKEAQRNFIKPDEVLSNYLQDSKPDKKDEFKENSISQEASNKLDSNRKQNIQFSEMEKRKKIQVNREKKPLSLDRNPRSLIKQMSSFQTNKDAILRDGINSVREENNSDKGNKNNLEENGASGSGDGRKEANLRSAKQNDKGKLDAKIEINQAGENKIPKIKLATDKLLKSMIENVPGTFTLSAFYVYIHVFLHQIFPNYFSKLGHEWVPANIKKSKPKKAEEIGDKIGIIEKPATGCCCLFHLVVIIIICAIIYFMVNWAEVAWEWFKGLFS